MHITVVCFFCIKFPREDFFNALSMGFFHHRLIAFQPKFIVPTVFYRKLVLERKFNGNPLTKKRNFPRSFRIQRVLKFIYMVSISPLYTPETFLLMLLIGTNIV